MSRNREDNCHESALTCDGQRHYGCQQQDNYHYYRLSLLLAMFHGSVLSLSGTWKSVYDCTRRRRPTEQLGREATKVPSWSKNVIQRFWAPGEAKNEELLRCSNAHAISLSPLSTPRITCIKIPFLSRLSNFELATNKFHQVLALQHFKLSFFFLLNYYHSTFTAKRLIFIELHFIFKLE